MKWLIGLLCLLLVLVACDTGGGSDASEEDLTSALLTVEDMPSGWTIDDNVDDAIQVCNAALFDELIDPDAEAKRHFTTGETGPFLTQHLAALEYEDDAIDGIDRIREAFGCGEWTDASSGTTWTISETTFPDLGDETAAYHVSSTGTDGVPTNGTAVVIRDGGVILLVVHVALGELDSSVTEELTREAFDKAREL